MFIWKTEAPKILRQIRLDYKDTTTMKVLAELKDPRQTQGAMREDVVLSDFTTSQGQVKAQSFVIHRNKKKENLDLYS